MSEAIDPQLLQSCVEPTSQKKFYRRLSFHAVVFLSMGAVLILSGFVIPNDVWKSLANEKSIQERLGQPLYQPLELSQARVHQFTASLNREKADRLALRFYEKDGEDYAPSEVSLRGLRLQCFIRDDQGHLLVSSKYDPEEDSGGADRMVLAELTDTMKSQNVIVDLDVVQPSLAFDDITAMLYFENEDTYSVRGSATDRPSIVPVVLSRIGAGFLLFGLLAVLVRLRRERQPTSEAVVEE